MWERTGAVPFPDGPRGSRKMGRGRGGPFREIQHYTHYSPAEVTSGKAQIHPSIERSTPRSCLPSRVVPHRPVVVFCNSCGI